MSNAEWNCWTIEAYQKGETRPMRRTGAKKGSTYHLKAHYHIAGQNRKTGSNMPPDRLACLRYK